MKLNGLHQSKTQGFTLIEILIAMLIGLFLVAGVLQIFINSKQSYRMQEALARLQESGRFALDFLDRDIRMAGYRGCASRGASATLANNLNNAADYIYNFNIPIQGFDTTASSNAASWSPSHNSAVTGIASPSAGSDIITIRRGAEDSVQIMSNLLASSTLTVNRNTVPGLVNCDVVMVSDCSNVAIFKVSGWTPGTLSVSYAAPGGCAGGNAGVLTQTFAGGTLQKALTTSYYIRDNPNGQPALYRIINSNPEEELVEGVEKMQILYGQDGNSDGATDSYVTANSVTNWNNVTSVRISLLLRTVDDNIANTNLRYSYEDIDNALAPDRRIRRVFTTTIAIRNRLP